MSKPDYAYINRLEQELGMVLSDYTGEVGRLLTTGVQAARRAWTAPEPEPVKPEPKPEPPKPVLKPVEFVKASVSSAHVIYDEVLKPRSGIWYSVPTTGWLRSLQIRVDSTDDILRTGFMDINGQHIYHIGSGTRSQLMYPTPAGYRIPFEWGTDGRGCLPNQDTMYPYTFNIESRTEQRVTVIANSYDQPPATDINGNSNQTAPPYTGAFLRHMECWVSDASNWSVKGPFDILTGGHVLHRLWPVYAEGGGMWIMSAVEIAPYKLCITTVSSAGGGVLSGFWACAGNA